MPKDKSKSFNINTFTHAIFVHQQIQYMKNGSPFNLNKTALGQLDSNGTPYLKVRVIGSNEWITAAIDTGAFKSAVIPYFVNRVPLEIIDTEHQNFISDGLKEVNVYKLEFEIEGIDNVVFTEEVIGSPSTYTHQILIGSKFLSRCKEFKILLDKGYFKLKM